jgi:IS5 family transposase
MLGQGTPQGQIGIFGGDLATLLDPNDRLYRLAKFIPWDEMINDFAPLFKKGGRPSLPLRLMIGLTILKHTLDYSDEQLVDHWRQNPYWQFFCGESYFQWRFPCNPSEMTRFRKRIGEAGCERILKASLAIQNQRVDASHDIVVDSTVQEKNITYPTFAKLDVKVIERCRAIAQAEGIDLRQSYVRVLGKLRIQARNYRHKNPLVRRKARRAERRIRTIAKRLWREIQRKLKPSRLAAYTDIIARMGLAIRQDSTPGTERIHSLHEPDVVCIAKGKAHKPYEFGCKVSIAIDPTSGLVIGAHHMPGKQHDRASVPETLDQVRRLTGQEPKRVICDLGYRGRRSEGHVDIITPDALKGTAGSQRKRLRRALRRRQVVEATIGRLKALHRMNRNLLKGIIGDKLNVLLAAAGNNFRMWLRLFCAWLQSLLEWAVFDSRNGHSGNRKSSDHVLAMG